MLLGIDAGNYETKVIGDNWIDSFYSFFGEYRERDLANKLDSLSSDMWYEYKGRKGFAGTLALDESDFVYSRMGTSKAHEEMLIRVLIACHRAGELKYELSVSQPKEKFGERSQVIKEMLLGEHEFTLNGVTKRISIIKCDVVVEGAAAYILNPLPGTVRIIDIGSGTIHCITVKDGRFIDKLSITLPYGMETIQSKDPFELSRGIYNATRFDKEDTTMIIGASAEMMLEPINEYYINAFCLYPEHKEKKLSPKFANALSNYYFGMMSYEYRE